jgi:hypothetical protein
MLHPRSGAALHVKLTYFDDRPAAMRTRRTPVTLSLGSTALTPVDEVPIAPANEGFILAYDIPAPLWHAAGEQLIITTSTWNPVRAGVSDRNDELGIFINNLEVWADGIPVTIRKPVDIDPVPSTPRQVWVWANYPDYPHLLDWWPWVLHDARLPRGASLLIVASMLGSIVLLTLVGAICFGIERGRRLQRGEERPVGRSSGNRASSLHCEAPDPDRHMTRR